MCLILLAYRVHPACPLVLLANRDEFLARPTAPLAFWEDYPGVLAGRDLQAGGTWFGLSRDGRIAAITNVRQPGGNQPDRPSRGALVSDYLTGTIPAREFLEALRARADNYNGFNLLVGDSSGIYHFSNRVQHVTRLEPGLHGISNAGLNTPWPKVTGGLADLGKVLEGAPSPDIEKLLPILLDESVPPDEALPATGVGTEWERILSSRLIRSDGYGTRSSTLLLVHGDGSCEVLELQHPDGARRHFRLP